MHEVAREDMDGLPASDGGCRSSADQRDAPRHTLLIRSAKLIALGMEFLCVVRDASETGVSVRVFHPLPDFQFMTLEMQNSDRLPVELVWRSEDRAGFRFAAPIDVARVIELPSSYKRRPLRVRLAIPAIVTAGLQQRVCELIDISQHGAKLTCSHQFAVQQRIKVTADDLPPIMAKILWRREQVYGLSFENTFQFGELAQIVAKAQERYALPDVTRPMVLPRAS